NKAFKLFEQSAEGEYLDGINMLGYCYEYGIGTNINNQKAFELYRKAFELYQKAADLGDSNAQYNLAFIYKDGKGVDKNDKKDFKMLKKSAIIVYIDGIMMLRYCYKYRI